METITYNGKSYPIRYVYLSDGDYIPVSTEELQELLFADDGRYVSAEAQITDEQIAFYVPNKIISKSEKQLSKYVMKNYY